MFSTIYIEKEISNHPRVSEICQRFSSVPKLTIDRYGEVFNRNNQSFRIQKKFPALILANKHDNFVLKAPDNYGINGKNNYYFSHMMNCIYDCRYCFLQGMYRSANYVLFINYEEFGRSIEKQIAQHAIEKSYYYSGYDCDSLALEPVSHFIDFIVPLFENQPNAILELRTKSTQIRSLLDRQNLDNCVIAYSFTPEDISTALEHKVPNIEKRIDAMVKLQQRGWKVAIRFEPMIYETDYQQHYHELFQKIFSKIDATLLESVSLGLFRMPDNFYKNIVKQFPEEPLFAGPIINNKGQTSYTTAIENEMMASCREQLLQYIPENIYYHCAN